MGYFIALTIIAVQLTTVLATQSVSLRCFLQEPVFMGIFNKTVELNSGSEKNPFDIDILKVDPVSFEQDGLFFETRDMEIRGINDAILDNIDLNFEMNQVSVTMHFNDVFVTSRYRSAGSLFLLPIEGDGTWIHSLKNTQIYAIMPFKLKVVNGEQYMDLKSYTFWYDVRDKAEFKFTNLYNGNEELSESMHTLINQNWKLLTIQFGRHFFNKVMNYLFTEVRQYMLETPLKDFTRC